MKAKRYFQNKLTELLNQADRQTISNFMSWSKDPITDFEHGELQYYQECIWEIEALEEKAKVYEAVKVLREILN
jgi:hypothetical protein